MVTVSAAGLHEESVGGTAGRPRVASPAGDRARWCRVADVGWTTR
jgi:hypothetical protein